MGWGNMFDALPRNSVDLTVFGYLFGQDLKGLGVLLGHRRRLQAAIVGLSGAAFAPLRTEAEPVTKLQDAAERSTAAAHRIRESYDNRDPARRTSAVGTSKSKLIIAGSCPSESASYRDC